MAATFHPNTVMINKQKSSNRKIDACPRTLQVSGCTVFGTILKRRRRKRGAASRLNILLPYSGLILKRSCNVAGSKLKPHLFSNKMLLHLPSSQGERCWKLI